MVTPIDANASLQVPREVRPATAAPVQTPPRPEPAPQEATRPAEANPMQSEDFRVTLSPQAREAYGAQGSPSADQGALASPVEMSAPAAAPAPAPAEPQAAATTPNAVGFGPGQQPPSGSMLDLLA